MIPCHVGHNGKTTLIAVVQFGHNGRTIILFVRSRHVHGIVTRRFQVGGLLLVLRRLYFFVVFVFCSVDFGGVLVVVAVAMSFVGVVIAELMVVVLIVSCYSFGTTMKMLDGLCYFVML